MMKRNGRYRVKDFLPHISKSGGIISTIARRVGCDWHTAKKYIELRPTLKKAYENELENSLDVAESVIFDNIRLARDYQVRAQEQVETGDARWFLTMKGKRRGYTERREISGPDGGAITHAIPSLEQILKPALDRLYPDAVPDDG